MSTSEREYLQLRFHELLGKDRTVYTEEQRKERWNKWKEIATKAGEGELVEWWLNMEACQGCKYLNSEEAWCKLQGLPSCVNPITTFTDGILGMACMGTGYSPEEPVQLSMFNQPLF